MQSKIALKNKILLIFIIAAIALSGAFIFYFVIEKQTQSDSASLIQNTSISSDQGRLISEYPVRLKIPSINVDAAVEDAGLTSDGEIGVPEGPTDVAWFDLGPRPGEKGDSIIVGHFGWKDNIPAVFDDLNKLRKGDKIYIEDNKGAIISFVVRESRTYNPEANASDAFNSSDDKSHLNLITCEGTWNKITKSYSDRLVVFADKE